MQCGQRGAGLALLFMVISGDVNAVRADECSGSEVVRLDGAEVRDASGKVVVPAGPLNGARAKDQDGNGTCYAESLSTALRTVLKENAEISSFTTAVLGSDDSRGSAMQSKDSSVPRLKSDPGKSEVFFTGGHVCATFDRLKGKMEDVVTSRVVESVDKKTKKKKRTTVQEKERKFVQGPGLCKASDVLIEKVFDQSPSDRAQERLLDSLGRYFDSAKSDADLQQLNTLMPRLLENAGREAAAACEKPGLRQVDRFVERMRDRAETVSKQGDQSLALQAKINAIQSESMRASQALFDKQNLRDKLQDRIAGRGIRGKLTNDKKREELQTQVDQLENEIKILEKRVEAARAKDKPLLDPLYAEQSKLDPAAQWVNAKELARIRKDLSQTPQPGTSFISKEKWDQFERRFTEALAKDPEARRVDRWLPGLLRKLGVPESWMELYRVELNVPEKTRLEIPADLARSPEECRRLVARDYFVDPKRLTKGIEGADVACRDPEKVRKFVNSVTNVYDEELLNGPMPETALLLQRIDETLKNGSLSPKEFFMSVAAPGCTDDKRIHIPEELSCTEKYLKTPLSSQYRKKADQVRDSDDQRFNQDLTTAIQSRRAVAFSICATGLENLSLDLGTTCGGPHAVTLVGYRCNRGKREYLFQNSYGKNNSGCKDCEQDGGGRFWISSARIQAITTSYAVFETAKPDPARAPAGTRKTENPGTTHGTKRK